MHILVNYSINKKTQNIAISNFKLNDERVVLFSEKIAVFNTETNIEEPLTLITSDKVPFPIIVTKVEADALIAQSESAQAATQEAEEEETLKTELEAS